MSGLKASTAPQRVNPSDVVRFSANRVELVRLMRLTQPDDLDAIHVFGRYFNHETKRSVLEELAERWKKTPDWKEKTEKSNHLLTSSWLNGELYGLQLTNESLRETGHYAVWLMSSNDVELLEKIALDPRSTDSVFRYILLNDSFSSKTDNVFNILVENLTDDNAETVKGKIWLALSMASLNESTVGNYIAHLKEEYQHVSGPYGWTVGFEGFRHQKIPADVQKEIAEHELATFGVLGLSSNPHITESASTRICERILSSPFPSTGSRSSVLMVFSQTMLSLKTDYFAIKPLLLTERRKSIMEAARSNAIARTASIILQMKMSNASKNEVDSFLARKLAESGMLVYDMGWASMDLINRIAEVINHDVIVTLSEDPNPEINRFASEMLVHSAVS